MFDLNAFLDRGPIKLVAGPGTPDRGGCWMSALSLYAGEYWSDQPECVCPIIRKFCIKANDLLPSDEARGRFIGPKLFDPVGTRTDDPVISMRRGRYVIDAVARRFVPVAVEAIAGVLDSGRDKASLIKMGDHLRNMEPLYDWSANADRDQPVNEQVCRIVNKISNTRFTQLDRDQFGLLDAETRSVYTGARYLVNLDTERGCFGHMSMFMECLGKALVGTTNTMTVTARMALESKKVQDVREQLVTEYLLPLIDELIAIGDRRPVEPACSEQQLAQACQMNA